MDANKKALFDNIYKIIFTVFTILLGGAFALFSYTILVKGKEAIETDPNYIIYNIDIVKTYLNYLVIPFVLWVLIIIGGFILKYVVKFESKQKNKINPVDTYNILSKKIKNIDDLSLLKDINKERKIRSIIFIAVSFVALLMMIMPARYLFNKNNFPGIDTNDEVTKMVLNILPYIIVSFVLFGGYIFYYIKSIKKEISLIKDILKQVKLNPVVSKNNQLGINITRCVVFATSITFIILGVINGGYNDILVKAINICTECIGLA